MLCSTIFPGPILSLNFLIELLFLKPGPSFLVKHSHILCDYAVKVILWNMGVQETFLGFSLIFWSRFWNVLQTDKLVKVVTKCYKRSLLRPILFTVSRFVCCGVYHNPLYGSLTSLWFLQADADGVWLDAGPVCRVVGHDWGGDHHDTVEGLRRAPLEVHCSQPLCRNAAVSHGLLVDSPARNIAAGVSLGS